MRVLATVLFVVILIVALVLAMLVGITLVLPSGVAHWVILSLAGVFLVLAYYFTAKFKRDLVAG